MKRFAIAFLTVISARHSDLAISLFVLPSQIRDKIVLRLPSFSGHPVNADLVSVREDVHCESTTPEIHAGVPA